jgi:hypothetical protein
VSTLTLAEAANAIGKSKPNQAAFVQCLNSGQFSEVVRKSIVSDGQENSDRSRPVLRRSPSAFVRSFSSIRAAWPAGRVRSILSTEQIYALRVAHAAAAGRVRGRGT